MRIAETVTFGGSGLNRAAHLRGQDAQITELFQSKDARVLPFWRGKPLVIVEDTARAAWIAADHPVLRAAKEAPVFLGLEDTGARFAVDISAWEPEVVDEAFLGLFLDPTEQHHPDLPKDHLFRELRAIMTLLSPRDAEFLASAKAVLGWHGTHGFCARCGVKTEVTMAGWQRACPACNAHHFPRTDPVVIMLITHGNSVLMGRSPGWPEGMYSLLAGFVEPGETLEAAVRREVFEESGIRVGPVDYLASQPWPFPASMMLGCRGEALDAQITIDPVEIEDALWVTREEMLEVFAGGHKTIRPARKGAIAHFILSNWLADRLD